VEEEMVMQWRDSKEEAQDERTAQPWVPIIPYGAKANITTTTADSLADSARKVIWVIGSATNKVRPCTVVDSTAERNWNTLPRQSRDPLRITTTTTTTSMFLLLLHAWIITTTLDISSGAIPILEDMLALMLTISAVAVTAAAPAATVEANITFHIRPLSIATVVNGSTQPSFPNPHPPPRLPTNSSHRALLHSHRLLHFRQRHHIHTIHNLSSSAAIINHNNLPNNTLTNLPNAPIHIPPRTPLPMPNLPKKVSPPSRPEPPLGDPSEWL